MSMQSWRDEFYPVPASAGMSDLEAIRHGLRKWEGHRAENVARHGLKFDSDNIVIPYFKIMDSRGRSFVFGEKECALCAKYINTVIDCHRCPIALSGQRPCTEKGRNIAYRKAIERGDTQAMIDALKLAERYVLERDGEAA